MIGIKNSSLPYPAVLDRIQDLDLVFYQADDWQTGINALTLFLHPKRKILGTKLRDDTRELLEAA
jgi:hypothetical protein